MKKLKITYEEGCFDDIAEEMTQEELDALIADIERLVESGELFENGQPLDEEETEVLLRQLDRKQKNTRQ